MWLFVISGLKAGAVVLHKDDAVGLCLPGLYPDVQRLGIRVSAMDNGVLHDGLQGQRREMKLGIRRVVFDEKAVIILGPAYSKVCAGVIQFLGEGDETLVGNGGEILAKVQRQLLFRTTCWHHPSTIICFGPLRA